MSRKIILSVEFVPRPSGARTKRPGPGRAERYRGSDLGRAVVRCLRNPSSSATQIYLARKIHSARASGYRCSHFFQMRKRDSVGVCSSSATYNSEVKAILLRRFHGVWLHRKSRPTRRQPTLAITPLLSSRKPRRVSGIRIDKVCCCGFRSMSLPPFSRKLVHFPSTALFASRLRPEGGEGKVSPETLAKAVEFMKDAFGKQLSTDALVYRRRTKFD
jgi:hypothetical protein